jgi:hypothetical protein
MISIKNLLLLLITFFLFTSCTEADNTDKREISEAYITNVNDAYMRWSGTNPAVDLHVEKAQYWQSSHFSKECILYLKLKPTLEWWKAFTEQNKLQRTTESWNASLDTPDWFKPANSCIQHGPSGNFDQGSRYFRDTLTGECFIYEIQL